MPYAFRIVIGIFLREKTKKQKRRKRNSNIEVIVRTLNMYDFYIRRLEESKENRNSRRWWWWLRCGPSIVASNRGKSLYVHTYVPLREKNDFKFSSNLESLDSFNQEISNSSRATVVTIASKACTSTLLSTNSAVKTTSSKINCRTNELITVSAATPFTIIRTNS